MDSARRKSGCGRAAPRGLAPGHVCRVERKPGPSHSLLVIEGFELSALTASFLCPLRSFLSG